MCAMALKVLMAGRTPHSIWPPRVRERALKSAGKLTNTHGGGAGAGPLGSLGEPPARGTLGASTTGTQRRFGGGGYPLSPAGKVLIIVLLLYWH
jgi:hypothetical protein